MIYRAVPFDRLGGADLVLDATYLGGPQPNVGADPLGRLLPGVGNQGGFRFRGGPNLGRCEFAVLYTSGTDIDWPDYIDPESGRFVYFGDNKTPGKELHSTSRGGNRFLRDLFEAIHSTPPRRDLVPPIFVFENGMRGRDKVFRGLAVPGSRDTTPIEDLVAVWKTTGRHRFQNYRAVFSIIDCDRVERTWLQELAAGSRLGPSCPNHWKEWVLTGRYIPLEAERTTVVRSKAEQLPDSHEGRQIIRQTHAHFREAPHRFESCAASLWKLSAPNTTNIDVTRPSRDGGRDAIGHYSLGPLSDRIQIDFALEAKCYEMSHGSGVEDTARLVSRLRHRQFGVFVTTSYVSEQAYRELREDQHPVVVISARDIVDILRRHQLGDASSVDKWLRQEFPVQ